MTVNARGTFQTHTVDKHTCVKGNVPDAKYIVYVHRVRSGWIQEISSKFNPHVIRVHVGIGTVRNFFEAKRLKVQCSRKTMPTSRQMLFLTLCGIRNFTGGKKVVTKYIILFSKLPYFFANSIKSCCYFSSLHDKKIKAPKGQYAPSESESDFESQGVSVQGKRAGGLCLRGSPSPGTDI